MFKVGFVRRVLIRFDLTMLLGMSDLLSPIYIVFDANEADAFWGLVGVMEIMVGFTSRPLDVTDRSGGDKLPARSKRDEAAVVDIAAAHRGHGPGAVRSSR